MAPHGVEAHHGVVDAVAGFAGEEAAMVVVVFDGIHCDGAGSCISITQLL